MVWHAIYRAINGNAVTRQFQGKTRDAVVKFAKGNPPVTKSSLFTVSPKGKEEKVK